MKVKTLILVILILGINNGFSQEYKFSPIYKTIIAPEKGKRLLKQCSRMTPRKIKRFWAPSTSEIEILEKIMELHWRDKGSRSVKSHEPQT